MGGYNIGLRRKVVAGQVNILDSTQVRYVTGGVTLDATKAAPDTDGKRRLRAGEFLGRIAATGKYAPVKRGVLAAAVTAPVAASLTTALAGDDNDLVFTAKVSGAAGNDIAIAYVDPADNDKELAVTVAGKAITVSLATGPAGAITSTAAEIQAAIEDTPAASALVSVADADGNDGTGVVAAMALTPLANGADNDLSRVTLDEEVLGGAAYFQAGDVVEIGNDQYTIATVDTATHAITFTSNLVADAALGAPVQAADGSAFAMLMLAEDVDFELDNSGAFGDQVATAFDWARVLTARLPRTPDPVVALELNNITFA